MVAFRLFGALIGLVVGATTFSSVFAAKIDGIALPASLGSLNDPAEVVGFIPFLRDVDIATDLRDLIRDAYRDSMETIWYILAALGIVGFVSSLFTEELTIETEEVGRQHLRRDMKRTNLRPWRRKWYPGGSLNRIQFDPTSYLMQLG
ncbi:hypothetical protein BDV19DRAFT_390363 [Aspergillus venezuelensis]